jgi:hypothetical protein
MVIHRGVRRDSSEDKRKLEIFTAENTENPEKKRWLFTAENAENAEKKNNDETTEFTEITENFFISSLWTPSALPKARL